MNNLEVSNFKIEETEGVFTFKNENTTIGFVRFNEKGEVEYIFVNPIFRKQGLACLLYTSQSPRDRQKSRMPSSA